MKNKIIILLTMLLVLASPVSAILVKEVCLNDTHSQLSWSATVDGEPSNFTQVINCTSNCTDQQCNATSQRVDYMPIFASAFVSVVFIILGLIFKFNLGVGDRNIVKIAEVAARIIFLIVGIYFILTTVSLAYLGSVSGGSSLKTQALLERMIFQVSNIEYFLVFLVMLAFLVSIIFHYVKTIERSGKSAQRKGGSGYRK